MMELLKRIQRIDWRLCGLGWRILIPLLSICLCLSQPVNATWTSQPADPEEYSGTIGTESLSDLYGVGVRVGLYTQATGMIMSSFVLNVGGIKMACSTTMLSLLVCWTKLVMAKTISPCEALLVLVLAGIPKASVMMMLAVTKGGSSIIPTLALCTAVTWCLAGSFWFWTTLNNVLPLNGTPNKTWFFGEVDICGWYRTFALVGTFLASIAFVSSAVAFMATLNDKIGNIKLIMGQTVKSMVDQWQSRRGYRVIGGSWALVELAYNVVTAEMIIKFNHLEATSDLTAPSQILPLVIGLSTLAMGASKVFQARAIFGAGKSGGGGGGGGGAAADSGGDKA
ncbi:hypothetical protein BX600DRAFT_499535 [Xylariales sp. PMI_506]|nr:hypothetical protein BX600DRAFT_499535 [Xylariales sp. PMI_506]